MKSNEVKELVNAKVIAQLDKGVAPWRQSWNTTQLGAGGRMYGGVNQLLLQMEAMEKGYKSNQRATYQSIQKLNGSVRSGEKGAIVTYRKMLHTVSKEGEEKTIPYLKYYHVFNLDQTTIEVIGKEQNQILDTAEQILDTFADKPVIELGVNPAYIPQLDKVKIPPLTAFETSDAYYAVMFHELVHSTGHEKRIGRPGVMQFDKFGSEQYAEEELVAEVGASYLSCHAGITRMLESSVSYIQGRKKKLQDDPNILFSASSKARKAYQYIIGQRGAILEAVSDPD